MDDVKKLPDEEVPKRLGSKPVGAPALPVIDTHEEYELSYIVVGGHCVSSWTNIFLDASIVLLAVYFIFVWKSSRVPANPSPRFLRSMPCLLMSGLLKSPWHQQFWCWLYQIGRVLVLYKNDSVQFYGIMHSDISRTLVGNKIVDNSDAVGASPVGAAPTTSSFST